MVDNFPRIIVNEIENLGISTKREVTKTEVRHMTRISFEAIVPAGEVARLIYLNRANKPINVTFECPQAEFDLNVSAVKLATGEIIPEEMTKRL